MAARPAPKTIASDLRPQERIMLFCLASGTDWHMAGVTYAMTHHLLVKNLIDRDHPGARFKLTPLGHEVLAALLKPPVNEQDG
jgi:hypothetical protein